MIRIAPIEEMHLTGVGQFLNENLNARIAAEEWVASLTQGWSESQPNFGMQLLDDERLVGVFCAIYSDQTVRGKTERFCNPHSWCVLDDYRNKGIGLVLQLLKQPGYHFTMFTPNPKVAQIFLGLKFRNLDDRLLIFPNLPSLLPKRGRFVESADESIAARLTGSVARDFAAHRHIRWLKFAAFGAGDEVCFVVYKRGRWKHMPCARLLHVSDPVLFARHGHLLRHHLLVSEGMPLSRIEARFLGKVLPLSYRMRRAQPKLVLTSTLDDSVVADLYSELVALDV